jgi:hypothetical protein
MKRAILEMMIDRYNKATGKHKEILGAELDKVTNSDLIKIRFADGKKEFKIKGSPRRLQRMTRIPLSEQLAFMKAGRTPFK